MAKRRFINNANVPKGRAHISQAVVYGDLVFVSGNVGRTPETGKVVPGGMAEQTRQTMENIGAILEEAGTSFENVLKMDCHLTSMDDFPLFNEVWESYFPDNPPARICTQAGALGPGFVVEIDAVATLPDD